MNIRFMIYFGAFLLILAIVVYGISYFSTKRLLPPYAKPSPQLPELINESPSPKLLPEPFDEKEIKSASEVWQRWENLKKETDMPVDELSL